MSASKPVLKRCVRLFCPTAAAARLSTASSALSAHRRLPRLQRDKENEPNQQHPTTPATLLSYARPPRLSIPSRQHYPEPVIPKHRRVRINLDRVRALSGWEKLELMRDFLQHKQVEDAVYTYTILKENELVARLKYQEYHDLFHLLLTNPNTYRNVILDVLSNIRRFGYTPTPSMLATLIKCCVKWRDLELANRAFEELKERDLGIEVDAYNSMLELFAGAHGTAQLQRGADLWREMVEMGAERNQETSIRAMEIFARLKQVETVKEIYTDLVSDLAQNRPSSRKTSAPSQQTLDNAYLSALVTGGAYEDAKVFFQTFTRPGGILAGEGLKSPKHLAKTFNILLKMCAAQGDAPLAAVYWKQLTLRGLQPDVVMYGRMIGILGSAGKSETAKELLDLAVERLPAAPGSKRFMQLRCSLLAAYANADDVSAARKVFEELRSDCAANGRPMLRSAVASMINAYIRAKDLSGALSTWEEAYTTSETETDDAGGRGLLRADIIARYRELYPEAEQPSA
ncbi:hypothetical protein HDU86_007017 [Geranomyces michiganensis]|nr:hypothetical protein HDU86_007017 [Geranomyces michiganensis]